MGESNQDAAEFLAAPSNSLPPDGQPTFVFDTHVFRFTEKAALIFREQFDALPSCQGQSFGVYYQTEEFAYEEKGRLTGQTCHIIEFDFPAMRASQVNLLLDDHLRNPAMTAHTVTYYLVPPSLQKIQGIRLDCVNLSQSNPYNFETGYYYHLPKRVLQDGM